MNNDSNSPETSEPPTAQQKHDSGEGDGDREKGQQSADKNARKPAKRPAKRAKKDAKRDESDQQAPESKDKSRSDDSNKGRGNDQESSSKSSGRRRRSRGSGKDSPSKPSSKHDSEQLAKQAWKIYLAEISEEGVTLIDQNAAKELARRCFELADTFMDEAERHRRG